MVVVNSNKNCYSSLWRILNSISSLKNYITIKIHWLFFPKMKGFKWKYKGKYSYIYDLTIAFPFPNPYPLPIPLSNNHSLKCIQITTITVIVNTIHRSE